MTYKEIQILPSITLHKVRDGGYVVTVYQPDMGISQRPVFACSNVDALLAYAAQVLTREIKSESDI